MLEPTLRRVLSEVRPLDGIHLLPQPRVKMEPVRNANAGLLTRRDPAASGIGAIARSFRAGRARRTLLEQNCSMRSEGL